MILRPTASLLLLLLAASAGCWGGLRDDLFREGVGELRGQVLGPVDPSRAWVQLEREGEAPLAVGVDDQGRFELRDLKAGSWQLFAANGLGGAIQRTAQIYAGRRVELTLEMAPGLAIEGEIRGPSDTLALLAVLSVAHSPLSFEVSGGQFALSGLPPGCVTLRADRSGYKPAIVEVCGPSGAEISGVELVLEPWEDGSEGLCAGCEGDEGCETGVCVVSTLGEASEQLCSRGCAVDTDCHQGFRCAEVELAVGGTSRACVPSVGSCLAASDALEGRECESDEACGLPELGDGICVEDRCSLPCAGDEDCPASGSCEAASEAGALGHCVF